MDRERGGLEGHAAFKGNVGVSVLRFTKTVFELESPAGVYSGGALPTTSKLLKLGEDL